MWEIRSATSPNSGSLDSIGYWWQNFKASMPGFVYWHIGSKPYFAPNLEKFAHIRQVQVPRKFQGIGVGKKLMVEAIERLKSDGIEEIVLATAESNKKARSLYESLGFREFQKQVHYKLPLKPV